VYWLDVGIAYGADKRYPHAPAARQALDGFCARAGLPHPSVTDGGAALEVVWVFDPPVEAVPWARSHRGQRVLQILRPRPELADDLEVTGAGLSIWHFLEGQDVEPYPIVLIAESDRQELTALQATIACRAWQRIFA
jgi:hypothetical protein